MTTGRINQVSREIYQGSNGQTRVRSPFPS